MPARPRRALEEAANSIAAKDADELIDDTREFVRKSPGVALAGAAIIGFALVRLVKSGLDQRQGARARRWDPGASDRRGRKPIGELFGQLIDEGKAYAKAELGLVQGQGRGQGRGSQEAGPARRRRLLLFLIAGVVVLSMTMALALATLVGPLGAAG